jgi:hypothetical protein
MLSLQGGVPWTVSTNFYLAQGFIISGIGRIIGSGRK